jgi:hypothetical protein
VGRRSPGKCGNTPHLSPNVRNKVGSLSPWRSRSDISRFCQRPPAELIRLLKHRVFASDPSSVILQSSRNKSRAPGVALSRIAHSLSDRVSRRGENFLIPGVSGFRSGLFQHRKSVAWPTRYIPVAMAQKIVGKATIRSIPPTPIPKRILSGEPETTL